MSNPAGPTRSSIFRPTTVREGVLPHDGPVHPQFASEAVRLSSFQDWPPGLRQKKEVMASAGLFYIGRSDHVKCFYCDGGLKEWQEEDDPWVEHAGWFHGCGFVKLVKGEEFIQRCRRNLVSTSNLHFVPDCIFKEDRKKEKERKEKEENINIITDKFSRAPSLPSPPYQPLPDGDCSGCRSFSKEVEIENNTRMQCKVCLSADVGVVFLPCGHLLVCTNCAPSLDTCPVCRRKINETIKVFMS